MRVLYIILLILLCTGCAPIHTDVVKIYDAKEFDYDCSRSYSIYVLIEGRKVEYIVGKAMYLKALNANEARVTYNFENGIVTPRDIGVR